jgi:hypothetical protein
MTGAPNFDTLLPLLAATWQGDVVMLGATFLSCAGALGFSILFTLGFTRVLFRGESPSRGQLERLADRPPSFLLPTHTTDVFGKQTEILRRLEREHQAARDRNRGRSMDMPE